MQKATQKSAERLGQSARPEPIQRGRETPLDPVLRLQRAIGNRAVGRLLAETGAQAKLRISQPGDPYEQEADRVADQVMRSVNRAGASVSSAPAGLQRKCAPCAEGGATCPKCEEEEKLRLQRKATPAGTTSVAGGDESVSDGFLSRLGAGRALDPALRSVLEPRFGYDFSGVRVHTDARAAESARAVNARAFTAGKDIVFGAGQYTLHSAEGRRLVAHELTHVVQQAGGGEIVVSTPQCNSPSSRITRSERPRIQRQLASVSGLLIGGTWLRLPRSVKLALADSGIDAALASIDLFPGQKLLGELWIFVKEGLIGFYQKLRSAAEDTKILVLDKIARIMAGQSLDYAKGLLVGLLKGFFLDGLLGIFRAVWELLKGLKHLWAFFEQVGEIIGGFPQEIQKLVEGFKNLGRGVLAQIEPGMEEVKKLLTDPTQFAALVTEIVEKGKGLAKRAGEKIAETLLKFFSKPGAEAEVGEVAGSTIGMVLFEVVFAIVTAGGGVGVTGAKTALKTAAGFLRSLAGKIVGSVLKIFRELHAHIEPVIDAVKAAAKFLRGRVLSGLAQKFGRLLDEVKTFVKFLLQGCVEASRITCDLAKKALRNISSVISELRKVAKGIPGVEELIARIRTARVPAFVHGLVFQAERAIEYAKAGKLLKVEVTEVVGEQVARFDMLIMDIGRIRGGGKGITEFILETKNWTGFSKWDAATQRARLANLGEQLEKFMKKGTPVRLEWKGPAPPKVKEFLGPFIRRGVDFKEIK